MVLAVVIAVKLLNQSWITKKIKDLPNYLLHWNWIAVLLLYWFPVYKNIKNYNPLWLRLIKNLRGCFTLWNWSESWNFQLHNGCIKSTVSFRMSMYLLRSFNRSIWEPHSAPRIFLLVPLCSHFGFFVHFQLLLKSLLLSHLA